jgi:hypothetical protein
MKTPWLVVCWTIWVALAVANPGGSEDSNLGKVSRSHRFLAEAVRACNGLPEGTRCRFDREEQQLSGVCRSGSEGEPRAYAPNDLASPVGNLSGEAIRVGHGMPHGTDCQFTDEGSQVSGTCRAGPQNSPGTCVPNRLSQRN